MDKHASWLSRSLAVTPTGINSNRGSLTQPAPVNIVADTALTLMYPIVQIPVNNLTKKVYLSSLSIGSTEDNSQLFCLLHNGYLGVLVH